MTVARTTPGRSLTSSSLNSPWAASIPERVVASQPLRRSGLLHSVILASAGCVLFWGFGHLTLATVSWGFASVILLISWIQPELYRPIERFGLRLGEWFGKGLTLLLLVPLYVVVFVPVGFWMRLRGIDPLLRTRRLPTESYWIPRNPEIKKANPRHQYLIEDRTARQIRRPCATTDGRSTS